MKLINCITILGAGVIASFAGADTFSEEGFPPTRRRRLCKYENTDWADMPSAAQSAASTLGYTQSSWDNNFDNCSACSKDWSELTSSQKSAAGILGYSSSTWNNGCGSGGGGGSGGGIACFSGLTTVQVLGKGSVDMEVLQVGDKVLTASNDYQSVYAFGHYKPEELREFVQIHTRGQLKGKPLEMTPDHLVFKEGTSNAVRADSIKVGDQLMAGSGIGSFSVTKLKRVEREGIYAPFTAGGDIVVSGVVASNYVSLQDDATELLELHKSSLFDMTQHDYIHWTLAPFRILCLGVSSSLCNASNKAGTPYYVSFGINLTQWTFNQGLFVQSLVLSIILLLTGFCVMLERLFGAAYFALAVVAGSIAFIVTTKSHLNRKSKAH